MLGEGSPFYMHFNCVGALTKIYKCFAYSGISIERTGGPREKMILFVFLYLLMLTNSLQV